MGRGASLTSPGWRSCLRVSVSGGGTAVGRGRRSPLRGGEAARLRVWGRHCSGEGGVTHLSGVEKLRVSVSGGGTAVGRGRRSPLRGREAVCVSPCLGEALQWGGGVAHLSGVEKLRVSVSGGGTAVGRGRHSPLRGGEAVCVSPCLGEALQWGGGRHSPLRGGEAARLRVWGRHCSGEGASLTSPGWRSCVSPCLGEALQWGGGVAHLSGVEKLRVSVSENRELLRCPRSGDWC